MVSHVPLNPVKFTLLAACAVVPRNVRAYVPPVKLNDIELASVTAPGITEIAVEPVLMTLITGVPVTE
jgi:hypothetical protein